MLKLNFIVSEFIVCPFCERQGNVCCCKEIERWRQRVMFILEHKVMLVLLRGADMIYPKQYVLSRHHMNLCEQIKMFVFFYVTSYFTLINVARVFFTFTLGLISYHSSVINRTCKWHIWESFRYKKKSTPNDVWWLHIRFFSFFMRDFSAKSFIDSEYMWKIKINIIKF